MSNKTEESVIRLEAIYKEIEDKAKARARTLSGYDADTDENLGAYNPRKVYYEHIIRDYNAGATAYGERLVAAEDLIEKMVAALIKTKTYTIERDTLHTYGIFYKDDLEKALTDYNNYKLGKDADKQID